MSALKKFALIYHRYGASTSLGPGRQITNEKTIELSLAPNLASGYSMVSAAHMDAAEQLLEGCPIADSVSICEALPT